MLWWPGGEAGWGVCATEGGSQTKMQIGNVSEP